MDQLTIMRSFVVVTKSRSFSQAARQLGSSASPAPWCPGAAARPARQAGGAARDHQPKWIGSNDVGDAIVAFHSRHVRDCNLMLRKIADLKFALCAAPAYLRRAGRPVQVTDLSEHDCLANTNDPIWHLSQGGHDVHLKVSEPVYSSDSYLTLRKAAIAGRGIALLPMRLVSDEIADGTLVNVIGLRNEELTALVQADRARAEQLPVLDRLLTPELRAQRPDLAFLFRQMGTFNTAKMQDLRNLNSDGPTVAELANAPFPVMLLAGEKDAVLSPATVRRAGELLPNARVEVVTGAPHSMYWETPALFNDAVASFLKDVAAA